MKVVGEGRYNRIGRISSAAGPTNNLKPIACHVNRFAERNRDIRISCLIDGAVGRRGSGYSWGCLNSGRGKTEDKISRHHVRRIDYILITDLCRKDCNRADFSRPKSQCSD